MYRFILIFTFSFLIFFAFAQTEMDTIQPEKPKKEKPKKFKAKKHLKAANKMMTQGNIYAASDLLEEIMTQTPENVATAFMLAESYRIARDYKKAETWYSNVYEMNPVDFAQAAYWKALMMKMNGKYNEAKKIFDDFRKSYRGADQHLKSWAQVEAKGCDLALQLIENPLQLNVHHLNKNINSAYTDISPILWDDTTLLFASLPTDTVIVIDGKDVANDYFIKFYTATIRGKHQYSEAEVFRKFNAPGFHVANGAFSPDRDRFYFTRCGEFKKGGKILCSIFVSEWKEGAWSEPENLGTKINFPEHTTTHPFVAPLKKGTEILYFASDRPGGKGGLDLWYSQINLAKKDYSEPKNLGAKINTDRDEATPFVDPVSGTLYFSSNGHVNMGGYDIFQSSGSAAKWTEPNNIGYPINSSTDDMYFRINDDGRMGYFVSNRPGIISIRGETCCDDIFAFEYLKVIYVAVTGIVYDEDDESKKPLDKARVTLSLESGEGILQNIQVGEDSLFGKKEYFFPLNMDKSYRVAGSLEGYLTHSETFNTNNLTKSDTLTVDIPLRRFVLDKEYRLRNIYYDFDKWDLRPEAKLQLDTLYNLMLENPTIIVEIGSHTDSRGSDQYNLNLSQKRAESCVNYLITKGIQKERLKAKGYGETRHLEDCRQYSDCPEDNVSDCSCHQNNRRTEFKVVGELDAQLIYEDQRFGEESEIEKKPKKK